MNKVYIIIISALTIIIISLLAYIVIKNNIYKNTIADLKNENKELQTQVSTAKSMVDLQNAEIEKYAINIKEAEKKYKKEIDGINGRYNTLKRKYENLNNTDCQDKLEIISENQKNFLDNF